MARPRKVSDDKIFEAAMTVMMRRGPADWTLADVAKEAGLTAGALVQRFGSKRALQIRLATLFAEGLPAMLQAMRQAHRPPLAALRAYAEHMAGLAPSAEVFAHHLGYLELDLTDPDLHKQFLRQAVATRQYIQSLVEAGVAAGELPRGTDVAALTRRIEVTLTGSLFTWGTYQDGPAAEWLRHDLETLLGSLQET
jgi:AcrR family transcriptional regulator